MSTRNVIVVLKPTSEIMDVALAAGRFTPRIRGAVDTAFAFDESVIATVAEPLPGFTADTTFAPVPLAPSVRLPATSAIRNPFDVRLTIAAEIAQETSLYIVRGTLEYDDDSAFDRLRESENVRAVYSDPFIQPCPITCGGTGPVGTDQDVARLLGVDHLRDVGMDGSGVLLAIVDTGINLAHLHQRGKVPFHDEIRSWSPPGVTIRPFEMPVGHGTMCAYDALIAAPRATLLDIAVLQTRAIARPDESPITGLLSDAISAYNHLINVLADPNRRPGDFTSLVVSNSWGVFDPAWDFPVGHPGNYTHNPRHPFNEVVASLESYGADILFAAGNCGTDCPDGRCRFGTEDPTVCGANSHPQVLTVAGVDVTGDRVGYSSTGPGSLSRRKPDVSGFTHFAGSGVYPADGGTSAATPVVAGVVAAVRTRVPTGANNASPAALRDTVCKTAAERGNPGFDYAYGWGIVNGTRLSRLASTAPVPDAVASAVDTLAAGMRGGVSFTVDSNFPIDVTADVTTHTILGTAKATAGGTLNSADLVVENFSTGFRQKKAMGGSGSERSTSIKVNGSGTFKVAIEVNAGATTEWEGSVSVDGGSSVDSDKRTVPGSNIDRWPTTVTIS